MSDLVTVERRGYVSWITLNRPDRLNALNRELLGEFADRLGQAGADRDVRVVVIRGAGRAFSAGYDLSPGGDDVAVSGQVDITEDFDRLLGNIELFEGIWDLPKPVIAAVHGYCLAGASQLCVFCDITVVAENAVVGLPSLPVGGGYISPMWSFLVGAKRAKQMSFVVGSQITGKTASEWGWANYAVPEEDLWDDVTRLSERIAKLPPEVLRMKKYSINRVAEIQGFRSAMRMGAETDAVLHYSQAIGAMKDVIKDKGLKGAIAHFSEAGL